VLHAAALALALAAAPAGALAVGPATTPTVEPAAASTAIPTVEPMLASSEVVAPAPEPAPEPSEATTTEAPPRPPRPLRVEGSEQPADAGWLDQGHAFIERRLFLPVLWVDRFFADERDTEPQRSRSFVRVRQELNFTQFRGVSPGYGIGFNASLRFPSLDQRLERFRIEMVGEARDAVTALIQRERTGTDLPPEQQFGTADAGLGYRLWDTLQTHGDLGAGVMLQLPPGLYARARIRLVEPLSAGFLAREALTGFWRTDTHFGATGSAELERPVPFAYGALWRLSGTTTITQRSRGFEWAGDLSLIATVFLRIGGQLGFGISGATESLAPDGVDVYRFYLRLRRDVYRKWIFVEVQPEYQWPWSVVIGHRIGFWDVAFRLEIQFQGRQALPPEPPTDPSEPKDPPAQDALPRAPSSG
jgi:hypothetical protein